MITSLQVITDRSEYSRLEPERSVIKIRVVPSPVIAPDEAVKVFLLRKDGFELASIDVIFDNTSTYNKGLLASFDLTGIVDEKHVPKVVAGEYVVKAIGQTNNAEASKSVTVALVTVECLRKSYCVGLPLKQTDVVGAIKQPSLVTGVTIQQTSGTSPGVYLLKYNASDQSLQWNNGMVVEIAGSGSEILPDDMGNYIMVDIDSFELPLTDCAEGVVLDYAPISDEVLRNEIRNSIAEIERKLGSFIEEKQVATEPYFSNPDEGEHFDVMAAPAHFYRRDAFSATSLSWRVGLPYNNIKQMTILEGYFGGQKVLELQHGIFALNNKSGTVEILPQAAELSYIITFFTQLNYWGIRESITDFWRYKATVGIGNLGQNADIVKAIGYMAAIPVLTMAGQAIRGGRQSESFSKDGVSRSTSIGQTGVYGATVDQYQKWLGASLPQMRKKYVGFTMVTM